MVEAGSTQVWSSTRTDSYGHPLGGLVVSIDESHDPETGEIERAFICVDPFNTRPKLTVHRIAEKEVTQQGVEAVDPSRLTFLVRRLAEDLAEPNHRTGTKSKANATGTATMLTSVAARHIGWMDLMAGVMFGATGLAPAMTQAERRAAPVIDKATGSAFARGEWVKETRKIANEAGLSLGQVIQAVKTATNGRVDSLGVVHEDETAAVEAALQAQPSPASA